MNIRQKGQRGEREIAKILNQIVLDEIGWQSDNLPFQRNQLQTAVGGADLTNPFGLSIEVKRQEKLNIKQWWNQTVSSSEKFGGIPILLYKQNRKAWRCVMLMSADNITVPADIDFSDFLKWFKYYIKSYETPNNRADITR